MFRNELNRFLKRSFIWAAALSFARGFLRLLIFFPLTAVIIFGLDYWLDFSHDFRLGLWFVLLIVAAAVLVSGFRPFNLFSLSSRSRELAQRLSGQWRVDELRLIHAFLLEPLPAGSSRELADAYLAYSAEILREQSPADTFPDYPWRQRILMVLAGMGLLVGLGFVFPNPLRTVERIFWPFKSFDMETYIRVEPGDAEVPWGGEATIHVTCLVPSLEKPLLSIRAGHGWNRISSKTVSGSTLDFSLERITEPVLYKIDWNGESSRRYTLTPVKPIAITSFDIKVTPPAYTGDSTLSVTEPSLAVLPGSKIEFGINVSQPLEDARLTPPGISPVQGKSSGVSAFSFPFMAEKPGDFFIEGKFHGAWRPLGDSYSLQLNSDKEPTISLLSPDQDLVVGEREKLPLTYEAADDVGLGLISLEWQRSGINPSTREIQRFEPGKKSVLSTFDWDLPQEKFKAGEIVRYRLVAVDGNTVTGPGKAFTPWRTLEIRSFEQAHDDLEKELEEWRGEILDTLASSNALKKKLSATPNPASEQSEAGKALGDSSKRLEDHLKRIVSHMEADPLADYTVWMEHHSMQDNLEEMNRSLVPDIKQSISANQKSSAENRLGELSAELERMAALSEDLSKRQKADDVRENGEELEKLGQDLKKDMAQSSVGGKMSEADRRKLESMMADAQKMLSDIAKSLQQMPQELPEDFVNQAALKQVNLAKSQDTLSKMREALERGDTQAAMALAEQFQSEVKALRDQLAKAHKEYENGRSAAQMAKTMSDEQKKLNQIAQDQMDLLGKTQVLESKRMEAVRKKQSDRLKELAKRQQEVVRRAGGVVANDAVPLSLRIGVQAEGPGIFLVFKEFSDGRLEKSPETLEKIVNGLKASLNSVSISSATGASDTHWMMTEENALLQEIKKPEPEDDVFDNSDKETFQKLKTQQSSLRDQAGGLRSRLQKLSRQTASLGLSLTQSLEKAAESMGHASSALEEKASGPAYRSEEEALRSLMEAQSAMEQATGQASDMAEQEGSGSGGGGPMRVLGRRSGGASGAQNAPVRIPTEQDFRPPVAFREELLKSLKEKYPDIYEDVIHKYYRRLTE